MASPAEIDERVRLHTAAGELDAAASFLIRTYGAEVTGLLVSIAGDEARAADAFSLFCERVWRSLPSFRFESSARTWCYVLARRSLADVMRGLARGPKVAYRSPSQLPDVVMQAKSTTLPHLKTTNKDRLALVRAALSADDQMLLVLRLDRDMAWEDIASVLAPEESDTPDGRRRATAKLRKRYQRAKAKLTAAFTGTTED